VKTASGHSPIKAPLKKREDLLTRRGTVGKGKKLVCLGQRREGRGPKWGEGSSRQARVGRNTQSGPRGPDRGTQLKG